MVANWKRQLEDIETVFLRRDGFDLVKNQATALIERIMVNDNYYNEKSEHRVFADWMIGIYFYRNLAGWNSETSMEQLRMRQRHAPLLSQV